MTRTESWVGTWRPHKPRGPIAAQYSSPGPKYALPGLIGISNHDKTKTRAPIFSFGRRHDQPDSCTSPGPKYAIPSNITRAGRDGGPAFSLHSRVKEPKVLTVPGPGHYSPERSDKSVFRSASAFSLSGRSKDDRSNHLPGPASYTLPSVFGSKTVGIPGAPAYSLSGRTKVGSITEDLKKTPGPAAYRVVDTCLYKTKAPQYSATGRHYTPTEATRTPGPGAHVPERVIITRPKAPSFTFGIRHSEYIAPCLVDADERHL
ncbi:ciliary microtubule associated protein 1B [Neosynchiropus ocellatus]